MNELQQLVEQWRRNADMLAEGNKREGFCEGAGMQRACADQLHALLVLSARPEKEKEISRATPTEASSTTDQRAGDRER